MRTTWTSIVMAIAAVASVASVASVAAAVEPDASRYSFDGTAMGTDVRIVLYARDETTARAARDAAFERIRELEASLSDYDPTSELSRLLDTASAGKPVKVGEDLWRVLDRAQEYARTSDGAFDVTVGPVVRLWREARRKGRLPEPARLAEARALVGYRLVELDATGGTVTLLRPGVRVDFGAIGKGYAADEALARLRLHGITRALVEIGGDLVVGDAPPGAPGWRIGVLPHDGEVEGMQYLSLTNAGVATSGDREQYVVIDGRRYSHIVDPRTGVGLTDHSIVTVVAPDGMTADALASAVSVLGAERGVARIARFEGAEGRIVSAGAPGVSLRESVGWKDLVWVEPAPRTELTSWSPETTTASGPAPSAPVDPTVTPPVSWMLEPAPLPEAKATSEAEMKPYTEQISATDAKFEMVPIPGGKFLLGSPTDEPLRHDDEGPQVEVEIEPFWMGKHEVTWDEYEQWGLGYDFLRRESDGNKGSAYDRLADAVTRPTKPYSDMTFGMGKSRCPAICMSHLAAKVYCKWLSAKTGRYYRLPTEAEWEYACRAGSKTAYCFGNDPKELGDYAWYFGNSQEKYHDVGQKKPNAWGLHDMHGNVAEWVIDRYEANAYELFATEGPRNPLLVPKSLWPRSARGGSWRDDPDLCRSAARLGSTPNWNMGDPQFPQSPWYLTEGRFLGFRVVRPLRVPTAEEAQKFDLDESQRFELSDYIEFLAGRQ